MNELGLSVYAYISMLFPHILVEGDWVFNWIFA